MPKMLPSDDERAERGHGRPDGRRDARRPTSCTRPGDVAVAEQREEPITTMLTMAMAMPPGRSCSTRSPRRTTMMPAMQPSKT